MTLPGALPRGFPNVTPLGFAGTHVTSRRLVLFLLDLMGAFLLRPCAALCLIAPTALFMEMLLMDSPMSLFLDSPVLSYPGIASSHSSLARWYSPWLLGSLALTLTSCCLLPFLLDLTFSSWSSSSRIFWRYFSGICWRSSSLRVIWCSPLGFGGTPSASLLRGFPCAIPLGFAGAQPHSVSLCVLRLGFDGIFSVGLSRGLPGAVPPGFADACIRRRSPSRRAAVVTPRSSSSWISWRCSS